MDKKLEPIGKTFNEARQTVVKTAADEVLAKHPDIGDPKGPAGMTEPGTPGFKSDRDITARPRNEAIKKLDMITDPELKMKEVARLVKESGAVVAEMNDKLTKATGGVPDKTIDTNMYSWTGAEVKFPLSEGRQAKVDTATDIASLAEIHREMPPEAWEKFKEKSLAKTDEWQGTKAAGMAKKLSEQMARAEKISQDLTNRTNEHFERLRKERPSEARPALEMEARAQVAQELNKRLVELMDRTPVPFDEIASVQAQIKMVEPGAYASQAGIEDVVGRQQPQVRAADEIFKQREALDKLIKEGASQSKIDEQRAAVMKLEEQAKLDYKNAPQLTKRDAAQSAASTLAQFESHAPGKHAHGPLSATEAETVVKDAYKYAGRIAYLESLSTGRPVEVPDVANYSRKQLRDLISTWAGETGRDPKRPFEELAVEYSQARIDWARDTASNLKIEAMAGDATGQRVPANQKTLDENNAARAPEPPKPSGPIRTKVLVTPSKDKKDEDDEQ